MNKLELISALKTEADISKAEAAKVVQIFFDSMADAMADGERVEIRGLCSFFVKAYRSYTGRNPKTGQKVTIKPKSFLFSKPGKSSRSGWIDRWSGDPSPGPVADEAGSPSGPF
jgi:integration host factor subunit beta